MHIIFDYVKKKKKTIASVNSDCLQLHNERREKLKKWFVSFRESVKTAMGHQKKTNTVRSVMKYAVSEVCHLFSISTAEQVDIFHQTRIKDIIGFALALSGTLIGLDGMNTGKKMSWSVPREMVFAMSFRKV